MSALIINDDLKQYTYFLKMKYDVNVYFGSQFQNDIKIGFYKKTCL